MELPVAADSADDEYMTMEADKCSEHVDIDENGDTLGLDLRGIEDSRGLESGSDSRGQKKEESKNDKVATKRSLQNNRNLNTQRSPIHPLPERYITIRRPPMNANRGPGMKQPPQLVFFRCTTVCLMLLCLLLLGGLLGLSFYYGRLCENHMGLIKKEEKLLEKIDARLSVNDMGLIEKVDELLEKIDILRNISRANKTGHDLLILNEVLEWQVKGNSFYLGCKISENGECRVPFSWNCTSSPAGNTSTI